MAIMKPKTGHEACRIRIQEYLEWVKDNPTKSRALSIDLFNIDENILNERGNVDWAKQMDDTRKRWGHDDTDCNGKAVTYRHWIFSPDPRDEVSLQTLRAVCTEWVKQWLVGEGFCGSGRLGAYETAVITHDDNTGKIPHAHIVWNSTNLDGANKFHANKNDWCAMWDSAQEIAAAHGLTYHVRFGQEDPEFESAPPTWSKGVWLTKTEREMRKSGRYSWKDDIRSRVQIAKSLTNNDQDFQRELGHLGITRTEHTRTLRGEQKRDYVYTMAANGHWKCSGYRLGASYTEQRIAEHRSQQLKSGPSDEDMETIRANLDVWLKDVLANCISEVQTLTLRPDVSLKEMAELLRFNERYKIGGLKDYDKMAKSRMQGIKNTPNLSDKRKEQLREEYSAINRAKKLAEQSGLFDNVSYRPSSVLSAQERSGSAPVQVKEARRRQIAQNSRFRSSITRERERGGGGGRSATTPGGNEPDKTR